MTPRAMPPAVILGGGANAVSVARSLAALGVTVIAVGNKSSAVRRSNACTQFVDLGDGPNTQERWLEWLVGRGADGDVILPCEDDGLELVALNRSRLVDLGYVPVEANDEILLAMLDKGRTYELAESVGVPAPVTRKLDSEEAVRAAIEEATFPCVLKPVHSHRFQQSATRRRKVVIVSNPEEFATSVRHLQERGVEMMLTETIPGKDEYTSYYTYLDEQGEPLFAFTKTKIRQFPIHFGLGTYHVSDSNAEVAQLGLQFCQGIGLRGLGNVEFKRDARDGRLKIIECNHRFTAANELVRLSGIDIARFTYTRLAGMPQPDVSSYRTGVHMWHPVEDVRALIAYRRVGESTVGSWLVSLARRQHFPMFRWDDPRPTVGEFFKMGRKAARRLGRRASFRSAL